MPKLSTLLRDVRRCDLCADHLPAGPRPIVTAHEHARILVIGQAPGSRVHESGIPWDDASGNRLRQWLDVTPERFYDPELFAIVPMGFCYPGRGVSGDLPPRPECAETWHEKILGQLPHVDLTLLLSQYALARYLGDARKNSVTATVRAWKEYRPRVVPLPHPSPRNNGWLKKNGWFEEEVVPYLRRRTRHVLGKPR